MLEGYSEACPAHIALRAAGMVVRQSKVAQQNHWDYFICTTLLSYKPLSSPTLLQEQN